jgi:hypothetical protein
MQTYRITFNGQDNGTLRAKNAENALRNFLRILSATHVLKRGTLASVSRHNPDPVEHASVFLWTGFFGQPVWAIATRI